MDGNILVTPGELTKNAAEFSSAGNNMYQIANNMLQTAQSLSSIWSGESANTYMNNFKRFQGSFDKLKRTIDKHSEALTELANLYQQAEQQNIETASDFKNVLE